MKRIVASIVLFSMCAAGAAVIDGSYRIVLPKKKPLGVQNAIEEAGRELAAALKEGSGLDVEVVWSNEFKGKMRKSPAIFLGAGPAEKAGLMPPDLKGFENMIVEKGRNIYIFGRDAQRIKNEKKADWRRCVLPTVKGVSRFMEKFMNVRFLAPGAVGTDIPRIDKVEVPDGYSDRIAPPIDYAPAPYYTMMYGYAANAFGSGMYHSYG